MDEAVVSKNDAHVEVKVKDRHLDVLSVDKVLAAAQNTLFRGEADLSLDKEIEASINGQQIRMGVTFVVSSSSIDLIVLSGFDSDSGAMQVITADCTAERDAWEPRQVVYSYKLDYYHDAPSLVHFLL